MKNIFISLITMALMFCSNNALADEVYVKTGSIPQNGEACIEICLSNSDKLYTAGQMALLLPNGISAVLDSNNIPVVETGERLASTNHTIGASILSNGMVQFTVFSISSEAINGIDGTLFSLRIIADESLEAGTTLECKLMNIELSTTNAERVPFNDVAFSVPVTAPVDPWITLDENSIVIPNASNGNTDIKVKMTINAEEWRAICLPFAMNATQVYEVFGNDVKIAEFMEYEANDDLTGIDVIFDYALLAEDGFMANYPYIIKTSTDISEFMVNSTIEPVEDDCIAEFTNGKTGSRKEVYGTFYGTLYSGKSIPNNNLYINENKFWYSTGETTMTGFSGYFDFVDILTSDSDASNNIRMIITGEVVSGIDGIIHNTSQEDEWYTLQGVKISKPTQKGIYIKNGEKIFIK